MRETNGSFITAKKFDELVVRYNVETDEQGIERVKENLKSARSITQRRDTVLKNRTQIKNELDARDLGLSILTDFAQWVETNYHFKPVLLGGSVEIQGGKVVSTHDKQAPSGLKSKKGEDGDYYFSDFSSGRIKNGIKNTQLLFNLFKENIEEIRGYKIEEKYQNNIAWADLKKFVLDTYGISIKGKDDRTMTSPYGLDYSGEDDLQVRGDLDNDESLDALKIAMEINKNVLKKIENSKLLVKLLILFLNNMDLFSAITDEPRTRKMSLKEIMSAIGYT